MKETYARHLDFVDGVVFDFGGVMTPAPTGEWSIYPLCAEAGLTREMVDAGLARHRHEYDAGFVDCEGQYRAIFADNGVSAPAKEWFDRIYVEDSRGWRNPDLKTLAMMRECKALGKKVGILTNMSVQFFHDYFTPIFADFRATADAETVSGLEGLYKPERPIYDLMERRMGIPASRLLFLDDLPRNINAARGFGWRGEVFTGAE